MREHSNALSFYRSQNGLGWSKFFVPDQKFIYILWQSQTFCAWQKNDLHSVKLIFVPAQKFLKRLKKFGSAQNILGPVKGQGITLSFLIHTLLKIRGTFSCPNLFWTYRRTLFHRSQLNIRLETIHILRQQKEWFRNWQFLLTFSLYCIYAELLT